MDVEIGAEAALFSEKEYINGIFIAVYAVTLTSIVPLREPETQRTDIYKQIFCFVFYVLSVS
jgi:hypothetical protein